MNVIKKTILVSSMLICSLANAEDFRQASTNPFKRYEYKNEFAWNNNANNISNTTTQPNSYFTNSIQNPINIKQAKKYQHLINNAQNLNGCWDKAGQAYGIDPWLLLSIAKVESGFNNRATNLNTNRSIDLGMMQINTIWLPTLNKFGITKNHLMDPCTSVFVGAWIVAQNIRKFGYNQDGVGAYNSPGNVSIRRNYARKVYLAYNELVSDFADQIKVRR